MFRLIVFALMSLPSLALAQAGTSTTPPASPGEVVQSAGALWEAIAQKNWPLAVGVAITIIIWLLKKTGVLDKIKLGSKQGIRMSVVILAALGSVAGGFIKGLPPMEVVMATVVAASAAFGGWETVGKFLRDRTGGDKPEPEQEPK